ncbi:MAG: serine/threonine protein phosphatase [Bacteroidales bacterium]|nr:serine/threonine protein phosphatase [Bacteroidales bacterium]
MKKITLAFLLSLGFLTIYAQDRADQQHLDNSESFSMILLGDPQGYIKYDINQPLFELQTAWIADNIDNLNIKAVLCTGDLVEQNDNLIRNPRMLNQTSREMWENVSRSFERLDNKVPYIISTGNHEYGYRHSENGNTHYPEYFPIERNKKWYDCAVAVFPNRSGIESLENAAFEFEQPYWGKILVVCNEFAPRDEVLNWTADLINSDRFKNHKVIYITHSLLNERNASRTDNEPYDITPRNWGQQVWEKLLQPSDNIILAICGHTGTPGEFEDSVAYRIDKNQSGKDIHQMMFNVQVLGGGWEGNGGDGWLRILEFMPDGKTIGVKTYSPLFGISPSTRHLAHRTAPFDQFDIVIE